MSSNQRPLSPDLVEDEHDHHRPLQQHDEMESNNHNPSSESFPSGPNPSTTSITTTNAPQQSLSAGLSWSSSRRNNNEGDVLSLSTTPSDLVDRQELMGASPPNSEHVVRLSNSNKSNTFSPCSSSAAGPTSPMAIAETFTSTSSTSTDSNGSPKARGRDRTETGATYSTLGALSNDKSPPENDNSQTTTTTTKMPLRERLARNVARHHKKYFWGFLLVAMALGAISVVFRQPAVRLDTVGWPSRGTPIADQWTQFQLIEFHRGVLRKGCQGADDLWQRLVDDVPDGWEIPEREDWTVEYYDRTCDKLQAPESEAPSEAPTQAPTNGTTFVVIDPDEEEEVEVERARLPYVRKNLTDMIEKCDMNTYSNPYFFTNHRLWPVYKVKSKDASALDPDILEDICQAEEQTQNVLQLNGLCGGCEDSTCLPPHSLVLYARFAVSNGFNLDCYELAQAWASVQEKETERMKECVAHLLEHDDDSSIIPDDLGPCPSTFSPALVDMDFLETGRVKYTSSMYVTGRDGAVRKSYEYRDEFGRTSKVEVAYDSQYIVYVDEYGSQRLKKDVKYAAASAAFTFVAMLIHTRSPFLTLVAILQIMLGFPITYGIYTYIGKLDFFPFLNLVGVFVIFALGADHVFVAVDKWKNARNEKPNARTEDIAAKAFPSAAYAMVLTTITTSIAFFGSAVCRVAPIRLFAVFCGLLIVVDYILDCVIMFPSLCIYDGYRGRTNYFMDFRCGRKNKDAEEDGKEDNIQDASAKQESRDLEEIDADKEKILVSGGVKYSDKVKEFDVDLEDSNLIRRVLHAYHDVLHRFRWIILISCMVALAVCIYFGLQLDPPLNPEIRFLSDDVEYQKAANWRDSLLVEKYLQGGGAFAYIAWGLLPADTGDQNNPEKWSSLVLDHSFDPSSQDAQVHLRDICDDLFQQDFAPGGGLGSTCPFNLFDAWLKNQSLTEVEYRDDVYLQNCDNATSLPIPQDIFHSCLSAWAIEKQHRYILSWNGTIKVMVIPYTSRIMYQTPAEFTKDEFEITSKWMDQQNSEAPPEVSNAYFTSFDYWAWDTRVAVYDAANSSTIIAVTVTAAVILLSSRSILMTIYSAVSVTFILFSVMSLMVAAGWSLGFMESVCFSIVVGLSGDFVVHLSHAYTELEGDIDQHTRSRYSLLHLGPSVLAAAATTVFGAGLMLITEINFFQLFSKCVLYTIAMSVLGSFVFFMVLADSLGPSNPTYLADKAGEFCRGSEQLYEEEPLRKEKPKEEERMVRAVTHEAHANEADANVGANSNTSGGANADAEGSVPDLQIGVSQSYSFTVDF